MRQALFIAVLIAGLCAICSMALTNWSVNGLTILLLLMVGVIVAIVLAVDAQADHE